MIRNRLAGIVLAAGLAVTGTAIGATATAAPAVAATCCYKLPAGTWGGTTYYSDVHVGWYGNAANGERRELRYRKWHARYWNGSYWYTAVRYDGYYWSGNVLA